ncbi:MAG: C4-dicarboxylate ABC transporter, partial [Proteobacteria bacterium]
MTEKKPAMTTRRKFLAGAAVTGAATVAMPNVSRAETVTLKMQGAWGAQDMLNEMAQDFVKIVNELGEGRLKIDYLNAGAVVKPFSVMDGVHSGVLDGAHSVSA